MNMNINQWTGTPEERELRRAQLIGKAWVAAWREDSGNLANWLPVIRERTRLCYRWLWASEHYLKDTKDDKRRAQFAGDILLSAFADGSNSHLSVYWFNAAAETNEWAEGWLFDEQCLHADGWVETTGRTDDGGTWHGWHKPGS